MIGYVKKFEGNTRMSFKISDKQLLKKYNNICKIVKSLLNIKLDAELIYGDNDKYIKTKIKVQDGRVNTNFQDKKMPKEKVPCNCLPIIMLDSVIKEKKKYCTQTLLEEFKYGPKKIKMESLIDDDFKKRSSDESESDNDSNDETESDDENDNDESSE